MSDTPRRDNWTQHSEWAGLLSARLPKAAFEHARTAAPSPEDIRRFVKLWIAEGIPYAFEKRPILYQLLREMLGARLETDSRNISLTGSSRLGFSLAPDKYLRDFQPGESDLDIFAVSEPCFAKLRKSAIRWCDDFSNAGVTPGGPIQKSYWDSNLKEVPRNLARGFVTLNRVPNWPAYEPFGEINRLARSIRSSLTGARDIPEFKSSSIRVYRNWVDAERQIRINLESLFTKIRTKVALGPPPH